MANRLAELFERVSALRMEQRVEDARDNEEAWSDLSIEAQLRHTIEDAAYSGQLLHQGVRWASGIAMIAGALIGFGSLMALTAGDGTTPINVLWLIALTMVLPLCTVAFSAIFSVVLLASKTTRRDGLWMQFMRALVERGVRAAANTFDKKDPKNARRLKGALGVLRGSYSTIEPVVPWLLLRISQGFALWISIGFLSALLLRLAGIDLTFGWHTTIEAVSSGLPDIVRALSAPFRWIHPQFTLDAAVVESTRYSRFSSSFAGGTAAAQMSSQWWPFLFAGAITWGVLPRVAMIVWAKWNETRTIAQILRDTAPLHDIRQRLQDLKRSGPLFESMEAEDTTDPVKALEEAAKEGRKAREKHVPVQPAEDLVKTAAFLFWEQDVPVPATVQKRFETSLDAAAAYHSTWGNDAEEDTQLLQDVRAKKPTFIVVFVEPFANPGAGFRRQITALRSHVEPFTPILVSVGWYAPDGTLREHSERQIDVWRQTIDALADPALQLFEEETRDAP